MLDQRIEDARTAGKNPFDVMPSDDAAVAALIKPYTRTFQQTMNDLDTEQFGASRSEPAGAADLKTQAGIVAAHRAGKITREQATQALIDGGFAAAPPPTAAPAPALQVPLAR